MYLGTVTHHPFFQTVGENRVINMKHHLGRTVNTLGMPPPPPEEIPEFLYLLPSACVFWTLLQVAKVSLNQLHFPLYWELLAEAGE